MVADLLRSGTQVRAALRTPAGEAGLREALRRADADTEALETVFVSLTEDAGWADATAGMDGVYHLASPMIQSTNPDEVVLPARDGTLRVLRAARAAGVPRVVLTSSFAAIGYSPKPVRDYTEQDWTNPDTPGLATYPLSKTVAERAAWDFIDSEGGDMELVVINPTWIAGPTLTVDARSSLQVFTGILTGAMTHTPRQRFGIADGRDVAALHIAAMAAPDAAGKRYLALADGPTMTFLGVAQVLRERLGAFAGRVPTEDMPGSTGGMEEFHHAPPRSRLRLAAVRSGIPLRTALDCGLVGLASGV